MTIIKEEGVTPNVHYEVWSPFDAAATANALLKMLDESERDTDDKTQTGSGVIIMPKTPFSDRDGSLLYRPDDVQDGGVNGAKR
ncbi:MAG: hypothetical protein GC179_30305 [Anaerolineaceae bacterium]|nr:hypothetical protein [Anaerolineaceae bacterium]